MAASDSMTIRATIRSTPNGPFFSVCVEPDLLVAVEAERVALDDLNARLKAVSHQVTADTAGMALIQDVIRHWIDMLGRHGWLRTSHRPGVAKLFPCDEQNLCGHKRRRQLFLAEVSPLAQALPPATTITALEEGLRQALPSLRPGYYVAAFANESELSVAIEIMTAPPRGQLPGPLLGVWQAMEQPI